MVLQAHLSTAKHVIGNGKYGEQTFTKKCFLSAFIIHNTNYTAEKENNSVMKIESHQLVTAFI